MFPGNRPASVTVDPELDYTNKAQKAAFPGSRPASVTAVGQRDGDTSARKTTALPFGLPFGNSVTHLPENSSTAQTRNSSLGSEHGEGAVVDGSHQGAESPDHLFSQDGGAARSYKDPDALPVSLQGVDTSEHVGVAGEKTAPFMPAAATEDPEHKQN